MICPAIMPGTVTMPLDASEAVVGSSPKRIEETIDGRAASQAVAPSASNVSTSSRRSLMLSKKRLSPTARPALDLVCTAVILVTTVHSGAEYFLKNKDVVEWSNL